MLRLKCTKFHFGATDTAGGAYSAPTDSYLDLRGLLLRGGEGKEKVRDRKKKRRKGGNRDRKAKGA